MNGRAHALFKKKLHKSRAPANCKFFVWLALLDHCSIVDHRQRHHMHDSTECSLCHQEDEPIHHILLGCVYSMEVWARLLHLVGLLHLCPAQGDELLCGG
jgi:hypothetical protein